MLGKLVIFVFCFLGSFSLILAAMPSGFMANQGLWNPTYFRTDQEVCDFFNYHNITVYDSQASGNLTFDEHDTVTGGLPNGQLDVFWDDEYWMFGAPTGYSLGISYETQHWFLGIWSYWTYERLHFTSQAGAQRGDFVSKSELLDDENAAMNGTTYAARCNSGIQVSIYYSGNGTVDLDTSWDAGQLIYMMSWELNATSSTANMFTLLGQILTFQAPILGISGAFGDFLNALIAIPLYATSGYIIYKLIAGLAPWLSGGSGD